MNLADTLRGLLRRWYIVVPGLIVTVAVAIGAWQVIKPEYQRTATQLLLPGTASIPEAGNPYLFLGGLSQAADVLVTSMSSDNELKPILDGHPGGNVEVGRDPTTSGPMLLTTVTARTDAEAGQILDATVARTKVVLGNLQDVDGITAGNRIGIKTITEDQRSTLQQKTRVLGVAAAAIVTLLLTFFIAALVDGLSTRRRRRTSAATAGADVESDALEGDDSPTDGRTDHLDAFRDLDDDAPTDPSADQPQNLERERSREPERVTSLDDTDSPDPNDVGRDLLETPASAGGTSNPRRLG